jgi:sec-independent protein translocase protein TatA
MEGFGIDKLVLILVIVLVLFGARRIPEIGASIGKGIREFKRGMHDVGRDVHHDADADADAAGPSRLASPSSTADHSADHSAKTNVEPKRLL